MLYGLKPFFCQQFDPPFVPFFRFRGEKLATCVFDLYYIIKNSPFKETSHRTEKIVIRGCKVRAIRWMWKQFDSIKFFDFFLGSNRCLWFRVVLK